MHFSIIETSRYTTSASHFMQIIAVVTSVDFCQPVLCLAVNAAPRTSFLFQTFLAVLTNRLDRFLRRPSYFVLHTRSLWKVVPFGCLLIEEPCY